MAAFDLKTQEIQSVQWDDGETVTIKQLTFGQANRLSNDTVKHLTIGDIMRGYHNITIGEIDADDYGLQVVHTCIVSWTLKEPDGTTAKLTLGNVKALPTIYSDFIREAIERLNDNVEF